MRGLFLARMFFSALLALYCTARLLGLIPY